MATDRRWYVLFILVAGLVPCAAAQDNVPEGQVFTGTPGAVARGDTVTISGIAVGSPDAVYVWVFGTNYRSLGEPVTVESDGIYRYTLERSETERFSPGRYFVIVQHPMSNGEQDVRIVSDGTISVPGGGTVDLAALPADEAATAVTSALNSPYSDDTYTVVSFLVENPWIRIGGAGSTGETAPTATG